MEVRKECSDITKRESEKLGIGHTADSSSPPEESGKGRRDPWTRQIAVICLDGSIPALFYVPDDFGAARLSD